MNLKFKVLNGGKLPTRAHKEDAGFDLYSPIDLFTLAHTQSCIIRLKVCVEIPKGYVGFIMGRSSLHKKGIICLTGVIDSGYTGELRAMFFNATNHHPIDIHKDERICQLVILKLADIERVEHIEELESSERGDKGFGSTGA